MVIVAARHDPQGRLQSMHKSFWTLFNVHTENAVRIICAVKKVGVKLTYM